MFTTITTHVRGEAKVLDQVTYEDRANHPTHFIVIETPDEASYYPQYKLLNLETKTFEYSDLRQAGWTRSERIDFDLEDLLAGKAILDCD